VCVQPFPKAAIVPVATPNGHYGLVGCKGTIVVYATVCALKSLSFFGRTNAVVQCSNAVNPQRSGRRDGLVFRNAVARFVFETASEHAQQRNGYESKVYDVRLGFHDGCCLV